MWTGSYAKGRPKVQFYVNYNVEFSIIGAYFECVMSVKCFCDVCLFGDKFKRRFIGGGFCYHC